VDGSEWKGTGGDGMDGTRSAVSGGDGYDRKVARGNERKRVWNMRRTFQKQMQKRITKEVQTTKHDTNIRLSSTAAAQSKSATTSTLSSEMPSTFLSLKLRVSRCNANNISSILAKINE